MSEKGTWHTGEEKEELNEEEYISDDFKDDFAEPPDKTDESFSFGSEERETTYEEPLQYGSEPTSESLQPEVIDDEIRRRKRRRNWWLIGTLGIALPILIAVGSIVFVIMAIVGAFEQCAVQCCENCGDQCAQSCQETCCQSCSDQCNEACNNACVNACTCNCNISGVEKVNNFKNLIEWIYYSILGLFK